MISILRAPGFCAGGFFQIFVKVGMGGLHIFDDLKVFFFDFVQVNLLDMHQPQQFPNWPGNITTVLVARTPALRDPDFTPELLLVKPHSAAYFPGVEDLAE